MSGIEIAAIITAALGGLAGIGGLVVAITNARNAALKTDLDMLSGIVSTQRDQISNQAIQISNLQIENNALHDTDNGLKAENLQQRKELEAVREENRVLRTQVEKQAAEIIILREENTALKAQLDTYRKPMKPKE